MNKVLVDSVRCFHNSQAFSVRPLTILVGENSTGKSTLLAATRLAWDLCQGEAPPDFNEEPFVFGAFDQIASFKGGRGGRAKEFSLGIESSVSSQRRRSDPENLEQVMSVTGRFQNVAGQPSLMTWQFTCGNYRAEISQGPGSREPVLSVATPSSKYRIRRLIFLRTPTPYRELFGYLRFILRDRPDTNIGEVEGDTPDLREVELLGTLVNDFFRYLGNRPYAFAPIRTRPERTYDPLKDVPRPEGSHVPMILARTHSSDPDQWDTLHQALNSFGEASGLFSDLAVRRLGRKASDPFQIRIRISGPAFNLADVGYGVSQALPLVVDALEMPKKTSFLVQQPEVHLHPKAQAELATWLAALAKAEDKTFIVETHSDHILDRVRVDVRDGEIIRPRDVLVIYCHRVNGRVELTEIQIDGSGNLVDAPREYRQFFLEEERRFLEGG